MNYSLKQSITWLLMVIQQLHHVRMLPVTTSSTAITKSEIKYLKEYGYLLAKDNYTKTEIAIATDSCQTSIIGAFSHMQDGLTYIFKDDKFWRLSAGYTIDNGYPKDLDKKWHRVPSHFDEVFVWGGNWSTYFFKGKYYYRYNNTADRVDDGYPYLISKGWRNVPDDIDAIFTDREYKTYFFKNDLVYLYDNARDKVAFGYPRKITEVYPNVPSTIDTVFRYYFDGEVYFFKDLFYWRWNVKYHRADGPFPINKRWVNLCFM